MNDGPVCREVGAVLHGDTGVIALDADLTAGELRRLVSGSRVLVTSRFHAMISGLSTCTPTVVVGWSHKYREVLDDFGLAKFGMDSSVLSAPDTVVAAVSECLDRHDGIAQQMRTALPGVKQRSALIFSVIDAAARK